MGIPIIYQPLSPTCSVLDLIHHDARSSYLFSRSYSLGMGPFEVFQNQAEALDLSKELIEGSDLFQTESDVVETVSRLSSEVLLALADDRNLLRRRLLAQRVFEVEDFFKEIAKQNGLLMVEPLLYHALFGQIPIMPDIALGSSGDTLKMVHHDVISSICAFFEQAHRELTLCNSDYIAYECNSIIEIYKDVLEKGDVIIVGD